MGVGGGSRRISRLGKIIEVRFLTVEHRMDDNSGSSPAQLPPFY